ncbi:unnamed protein product, partial [Ectocarpus sp. 12 AP-2014]
MAHRSISAGTLFPTARPSPPHSNLGYMGRTSSSPLIGNRCCGWCDHGSGGGSKHFLDIAPSLPRHSYQGGYAISTQEAPARWPLRLLRVHVASCKYLSER